MHCVCVDDHMIKQWDWERGWTCTQQYEGHGHYVMQVTFSQRDPALFASASLDKTIKVCVCMCACVCVL